jgi:hypothetical protein
MAVRLRVKAGTAAVDAHQRACGEPESLAPAR